MEFSDTTLPETRGLLTDWLKPIDNLGIKSLYIVPFKLDSEMCGNMNLSYTSGKHLLDENDRKFLLSTTNTIQIIIEKKLNRAKLIKALQNSYQAEKSNNYFLETIVNDFKNGLNKIAKQAEILRGGKSANADALECANSIEEAAKYLHDLIDNMSSVPQERLRANLDAEAAPNVSEEIKEPKADNISILIVDDIAINLKIQKAMCEKVGIKNISTAQSAEEAMNILKEKHVDIMLTDMWMPDVNGSEFADIVKEKYPNVKILLVTADIDVNENFPMEKFFDIIYKPVTDEKIRKIIKDVYR